MAAGIPLSEMKENQIENNISSDKIDSYTVIFYSIKGDTENVYSAIQIESIKYEIGKIGYQPVQDPSVFGVEAVIALSKNLIKVTGFCGANCPITDYIQLRDSVPYKLLHIEASTVEG